MMNEIRYDSIGQYVKAFIDNYESIAYVPIGTATEKPSNINMEILKIVHNVMTDENWNGILVTKFLMCAIKIGETHFASFSAAGTLHILNNPKVETNEFGRIHSVIGPAIQWDDLQVHMINGVRIPDAVMWKKIANREMHSLELFGITNIEQRRVALEHFGSDRMFAELKPKLIDSSKRGNKLWKTQVTIQIPRWGNVMEPREFPIAFLQYNDLYTKREYISYVDPKYEHADEAMASKFPLLTKEEYDLLEVEA